MKRTLPILVLVLALHATPARALDFGIALSVGEGVTFYDGEGYRSPVSIEVLPSISPIPWVKVDLGFFATLEDVRGGDRNFVLRPGVRITPPILPVYGRLALPLQTTNGFDWGFLVGVGASFGISIVSLFAEVDTFLTDDGDWGGTVVPLDFRVGVELSF